MSVAEYPAYKESGAVWLGAVPKLWHITPLKYLVSLRSGGTPSKDRQDYWDGDIPWASAKDLKSDRINDTIDHISEIALSESAATLAPANCLFVLVRGMTLAKAFPVVQIERPMAFNQDLKALTPFRSIEISFLAWALKAMARESMDRCEEAGHGTKALRMEAWLSLSLPVPPLPEQTVIATFLDRETGKIDALVQEQRRLIALLKEKRQAVISHAVTRGLNPNAPMKDSGIEWLGEVPAHWGVQPLKYFVTLKSGGTPSKHREDYWTGEIPWASAKDLKADRLYDTIDHLTDKAIAEGAASLNAPGSVLVLVRGMMLARAFPVVRIEVPMAINQDLKALTPIDDLDVDFLSWLLRATAQESMDRCDEAGHGTKALRTEAWLSMSLPSSPLPEQLRIVGHLDRTTGQLDKLVNQAEASITLLAERRAALISAAVTGKIDVRGLAQSEAVAA